MDLSLSAEQQQLADSLTRFVERDYTFEARRAIQRSAAGCSAAVWAQFADLGLLAMPLPEQYGGFGGNGTDTMVVMNAIGRGLIVEPYLATVVLGAGLIARAGSAAQQGECLPRVAEGTLRLAFAHQEPGARFDTGRVTATAAGSGAGFVLNGRKAVVLHGGQADALVVSAQLPEGISLFLVDRNAAGLAVRDYRTIDGLRAADVELAGVKVAGGDLIGTPGGALPAIEATLDAALAALCAEAVGVMEALNTQTLDYLKTRQQFGQPIGRFQALQHRAVDMFVAAKQSKSMAYLAAMKADVADAVERRRAVAAAKAYIGRAGRKLAQEAIQLHGGMGVTDELPVSHYAKRLTMIDFWLGDAEWHLRRFAAAA